MTKEQVIKVDNNETKARAILQSLVYALETDADRKSTRLNSSH